MGCGESAHVFAVASYSTYIQVKTLATGIGKLSRPSIEWPRDDDVLTGEIMVRISGLPIGI